MSWARCLAVFALAGVGGAGAAIAQPLQPSSASGSLGGGVVGDRPAAVASAEVDLSGWGAALGLGMRLRFVDDQLLAEDWDERSDIGRVLRYLLWADQLGDETSVSLAAGQLAGVALGHGSILAGYAAGVDFDRGRAGLEARFRHDSVDAHLLIDDLLAPEVLAARAAHRARPAVTVALSSALDLETSLAESSRALWLLGADASAGGRRGGLEGLLYVDGVAVVGHAVGAHVGARGAATFESGLSLSLQAEGRVGTDRYIPTWIGPLYVRDRVQAGDDMSSGSQLDRATEGGHRGLSWAAAATAEHAGFGRASASVATRPGLPPLVTAAASAPSFRDFQLGAWAAIEGRNGAALAAELRVLLPKQLFARFELARHYSRRGADEMGELSPLWVAAISLGATLTAP